LTLSQLGFRAGIMGAAAGALNPGAVPARVNWTSGTATSVLLTGRFLAAVGSPWKLAGLG
jgi:hypothetical protein